MLKAYSVLFEVSASPARFLNMVLIAGMKEAPDTARSQAYDRHARRSVVEQMKKPCCRWAPVDEGHKCSLHDGAAYPTSPAVRLGGADHVGSVVPQRVEVVRDVCGMKTQTLVDANCLGPIPSVLEAQVPTETGFDIVSFVSDILLSQ